MAILYNGGRQIIIKNKAPEIDESPGAVKASISHYSLRNALTGFPLAAFTD
jgi:hypothetical protein